MKPTILRQLILGYATIMLLMIVLGGYMAIKVNQINKLMRSIQDVDVAIIDLTERLSDRLLSQMAFNAKYIISKDQDFYEKIWELSEFFEQDLEKLEPLLITRDGKNRIAALTQLYKDILVFFRKEIQVMQNDSAYPRREYQLTKERLAGEINTRLDTIMELAILDRNVKIQESQRIGHRAQLILGIAVGSAIAIAFLISVINTQRICRPIIRLQKKTKEIAAGKFKKIDDISSPFEIKELADDFNLMIDRLKELDDMKLDFIGHVSHNLRTPLTAIKEANAIQIKGTYAGNPSKNLELLSIIKEGCERMIDSVNQILDLTRMDAKMMHYHFEKADILPIIQESVLKQAPIAMNKKIDLELKPTYDLPSVTLDQERIRQVVENLISNALKYSNEGSHVVLRACVKNYGRRYIQVSVEDTGYGIREADLDRIFEKFKRIERGRETAMGTGLGLSIAKHIITEHGGKIWAESKYGQGCTFYFTLPV